jgi:DNA-binding NtrC family response regulator
MLFSQGSMAGTELILIAEDHESIREMARHSLLRLGYSVLSAADGEEALRLAGEERPALAVLDVVMPKLGGAATAALPGASHLFPQWLHVGLDGAADHDAPDQLPPYSPTALGKLVRNVLDQHSQS